MRHERRPRGMGAAVTCFALVAGLAAHPGTVRADDAGWSSGARWQAAIGPVAGGLGFDPGLADYRWDARPAVQTGLSATVARDRLAAGVRYWRAHTTQASGIPGETRAPRVNLTGIELMAQARAVRRWGFELWGSVHGGLLHLGYDPDELTYEPGGGIEPITVAYAPIDEWGAGAGVEIRRELVQHLALAVSAEATTFSLDTAHRRGSEIVESRERFYLWSVRLQLSWLLPLG